MKKKGGARTDQGTSNGVGARFCQRNFRSFLLINKWGDFGQCLLMVIVSHFVLNSLSFFFNPRDIGYICIYIYICIHSCIYIDINKYIYIYLYMYIIIMGPCKPRAKHLTSRDCVDHPLVILRCKHDEVFGAMLDEWMFRKMRALDSWLVGKCQGKLPQKEGVFVGFFCAKKGLAMGFLGARGLENLRIHQLTLDDRFFRTESCTCRGLAH